MKMRSARTRELAATGVPATLVALAALHAAWALGWRWPGGSDRELAERVVGHGTDLPSRRAIWSVVALLGIAAATVRAAAQGGSRPVRAAAWGVAGVLTARGLLAIPMDLARGLEHPYDRLDVAIYTPLSLTLGLGTASLLARGSCR